MKKVLLVLVLASVLAAGAFADWWDSYAEGLEQESVFINVGIGWGFFDYDIGIPPIMAAVDIKLPIDLPITVGGFGSFSTQKYSYIGISFAYTEISFGARGAYHFNFVKNLDLYGVLSLGYVIYSTSVSGAYYDGLSDYWKKWYEDLYTIPSKFYWGTSAGARYFFTDLLGVYAELGWSATTFINAGLTLKF